MSLVAKPIWERARDWDETVEKGGAPDEDARKPFDAGLVLAAADVIEHWDKNTLAEKVNALRETLESLVETEQR